MDSIIGFVRSMRRRNLAEGTTRRRWDVLNAFAAWVAPRTVLEATRTDVEAFLDSRRCHDGTPIGSRTRYGYISHLHAFYLWALTEERTTVDPTGQILRPKLRRQLPRPISEADLTMAIEAADRTMSVWLHLGAYAGLRCAEMSALDGPDVSETDMLLRVTGKGDKERVVPIHPRLLLALRAYGVPRRGALFRRPQGTRIPPAMVSREGSLFLAGLGIDATMHQLRHRFGTRLLEATGDLRAVQELMGHASPNTTAIYTQVTASRLRHVIDTLGVEGVPAWQPALI